MRVEFTESDALLGNPGMGWQTFHCFATTDPHLQGLPSTAAYFRQYWWDLEPADGEFNFDLIDGLLADARAAGQRLAFRVMCVGTDPDRYHSPAWLQEAGCKGVEFTYGRPDLWPANATPPAELEVPFSRVEGEPVQWYWMPDFEDPVFLEKHTRLIAELGARYDGHPDLDLVDIGSVGLWGEWHMAGTGHDIPSPATCERICEAYRTAFSKTPLVYLIGNRAGLKQCVAQGVGWRADCLGDLGGFSDTWNHMEHCYRQRLQDAGAEEAWRAAPVAWESCWDIRKWFSEGWGIRGIFDYALDLHGSYLNNKSAPVPPEAMPEIERFLKRLGYRLVLRSLEHPDTARPGERLPIRMVWENVGVAPPYGDDLLAFRFGSPDGRGEARIVTETSVRGWLPGRRDVEERVPLPADLPPGRYTVDVGIVDPRTGEPCIRLAITAPEDNRWYPVGELAVDEEEKNAEGHHH